MYNVAYYYGNKYRERYPVNLSQHISRWLVVKWNFQNKWVIVPMKNNYILLQMPSSGTHFIMFLLMSGI